MWVEWDGLDLDGWFGLAGIHAEDGRLDRRSFPTTTLVHSF